LKQEPAKGGRSNELIADKENAPQRLNAVVNGSKGSSSEKVMAAPKPRPSKKSRKSISQTAAAAEGEDNCQVQ